MLTTTGYIGGLIVYVLSAIIALTLFNLWILRGAGAALRVALSLPCAALLITPAYIQAGADTLAPALVVTAFQWFSQGPEAAEHALRPLLLFTGLALAAGMLVGAFLFWRGRRAERPDPALDISAAG